MFSVFIRKARKQLDYNNKTFIMLKKNKKTLMVRYKAEMRGENG